MHQWSSGGALGGWGRTETLAEIWWSTFLPLGYSPLALRWPETQPSQQPKLLASTGHPGIPWMPRQMSSSTLHTNMGRIFQEQSTTQAASQAGLHRQAPPDAPGRSMALGTRRMTTRICG